MPKDELKYLFVTGMGRSGTTFVANLLANAPNVSSGHERIGNREYWLLSWYLGRDYILPFLEKEKKRIESEQVGKSVYIDVNSYLQNSASEIAEVFKTENVMHLMREPKEVIRSIYTRRNDNDIHLLPKGEVEIQKWLDNDRFYRVCVNWKMATSRLLEQNVPIIRFEQLVSDFEYLKTKVLDPLELDLSENDWKQAKSVRDNKTPSKAYRFLYAKAKGKQFQQDELGKFETWPIDYKTIYENHCAATATKLGY
jgi:hypothetical protein